MSMTMTIDDYYDFDEMQQLEAIWEAKLISSREDESHKVNTYQIDDFFVDEYFDRSRGRLRVKFVAMKKFQSKMVHLPTYRIAN